MMNPDDNGEIDATNLNFGFCSLPLAGSEPFAINASRPRQRVIRLLSRRSLLIAVKKRLRSPRRLPTQTGSVSFQLRQLSKRLTLCSTLNIHFIYGDCQF